MEQIVFDYSKNFFLLVSWHFRIFLSYFQQNLDKRLNAL